MAAPAVAASAVSSSICAESNAIAARRIDQHRRAVLATGQGAAEGDRMAGDDQADAKQPGERGKLLGRAGTLAVGGDHHRGDAGHHQPGCQPGDGQCLAGARRPDQQQRLLAQRQAAERDRLWPGRSASSPCRSAACSATPGRRGSPARQGGRGPAAPGGGKGSVVGFQRGGDLHAVANPAGGEDQRVLAQFGAHPRHRLAIAGAR